MSTSHSVGAAEAPAAPRTGLRRELRFWEAIALSIGIMAPTAAMALNGVAPAGLIGRAVPLAFIFATIGVLFVSYGFVRLSRYFSHAGSAFAFSGITLGPQAGFFAGWALLGTYVAFCCASTAEAGTFGVAFLSGINIDKSADYLVIALIAAVLIGLLAFGDIRVGTRSLLGMEGISVTLILILMVVIVVKLIAGTSPNGQTITADAFKLPSGTSLSAVASAAVFGFLSFGGFEGAAALGEETDNPRREIPRAIRNAVVGCGVFYILCILVQTWGFGTNAAGVKAFSTSGAPLGDLAHSYVGSGMEDAINFGATISAFASGLGATVAGARILFALSRHTPVERLFGRTSTRTGAPAGALAVVLTIGVGGDRGPADRRRLSGERVLLSRDDRRAVHARRLHRHQRGSDPVPVHRRPPRAVVGDRDPAARDRVHRVHDLQERAGRPVPIRPVPVLGGRLVAHRAGIHPVRAEACAPDRRRAHTRRRPRRGGPNPHVAAARPASSIKLDAAAARCLGPVGGRVGSGQQRVAIAFTERDPDARGQAVLGAAGAERNLDRILQAPADRERRLLVDPLAQRDELVAPEPRDGVPGSHGGV